MHLVQTPAINHGQLDLFPGSTLRMNETIDENPRTVNSERVYMYSM